MYVMYVMTTLPQFFPPKGPGPPVPLIFPKLNRVPLPFHNSLVRMTPPPLPPGQNGIIVIFAMVMAATTALALEK